MVMKMQRHTYVTFFMYIDDDWDKHRRTIFTTHYYKFVYDLLRIHQLELEIIPFRLCYLNRAQSSYLPRWLVSSEQSLTIGGGARVHVPVLLLRS